jgi:hypothetical protein
MLWGGLAVGIPIALHFFYRSRYRKLPWAAMKFLLQSVEQTSRRLRFQEILLLICRCALLVLLAMALARPSTSAGKGSTRGDAVDAVFVIDTSYSMEAREGPVTRIQQAKTAALSVLDQLPAHSTVQIVTCSDRASLLGPRAPSNLDQAKQIINDIQISHQATDFLPGVREAYAALRRGQSPNREVYLFSDMQKSGWDQQGTALVETLKAIHNGGAPSEDASKAPADPAASAGLPLRFPPATVYMVRCGSREPRNVAVVDIVPQSGIPHTGERAGFAILVRNSGQETVRNLQVSVTLDGATKEKETQPIAEIKRGETRAVPMTVKLDKVGLRILTAEVQSDELDADNRFDRVIYVRDQVRILVIDGAPDEREPEKSSSFFLAHALAPVREGERGKYHVQPRVIPASQAAASLLANQDIVVLVNVSVQPGGGRKSETLPADFVRHLHTFVRQGHGLVIFGGDNVSADAYNRLLFERHKLLPYKLEKLVEASADKPLYLDRNSIESPFYRKFRDDENYKGFNKVEVVRALGIDEPPPSAKPASEETETTGVLLRYSNGKAAVATRRVGNGEVMLITTSADPRWTDWPLRYGLYVPFLDVTQSHLLHVQTQNHNARAGEPLRWQPPEADAGRAFAVLQPDGRRVRLGQPSIEKGRPIVTAADTPHAGIYRIVPADESPEMREAKGTLAVPFAVVPDLHESENLETLPDSDIDKRLGFPVIHLSAWSDPSVFSGAERLKREWTMWLLTAVLALAFCETALAWLCGRAW